MGIYKEKFQDIQDLRDQYMALCKVCTELGLRFGRYEDDAKTILLKENVTNPSKEQLDKALDTVKEWHHAILFVYKTEKQNNGKLLEEMENDVLQKREPFPKIVSDMHRVLAGCQ